MYVCMYVKQATQMGTKERKQRLQNDVTGRLGFKLGFGLYFFHFPVSRFPLPIFRFPLPVLVPSIFCH